MVHQDIRVDARWAVKDEGREGGMDGERERKTQRDSKRHRDRLRHTERDRERWDTLF